MRSLGLGAFVCAVLSIMSGARAADALATIDGKPVTEADVAGKGGIKAQMECYEARKQAMDEYMFDQLVDMEAKKAGIPSGKVVENEVNSKIKKASDADVKKFYEDFKKGRGGNAPPFEQVSGQIREHLEKEKKSDRHQAYFDELKRKHKVAYLFQRPTLTVGNGDNASRGAERAPITIVEFSDFQCPYCKKGVEVVEEVLRAYRGKVKLFFRDFPLSFHQRALPAAQASRCANEQGKFWQYHDKLFENQGKLADDDFMKYAQDLRLDKSKFEACYKSGKYKESIEKDMKEGGQAGVTGTPAFFINGVPLSGARPFSDFKGVIDEQLAAARGSNSAVNSSKTTMP